MNQLYSKEERLLFGKNEIPKPTSLKTNKRVVCKFPFSRILGNRRPLAEKSDFECNSMSLIGSDGVQEQRHISQNKDEARPLQMTDLGTKKDRLSLDDTGQKTNGRYRARTCDPLIKSQLLYQLS